LADEIVHRPALVEAVTPSSAELSGNGSEGLLHGGDQRTAP